MSTAYTFDATIARAPFRRASSSLEPKAAEGSQRHIKAFARIFVISAAAVVMVGSLLLIRFDNPPTNDRGCTLSANLHNSLVRPAVAPLAIERDWHSLPILREPTGTDWIATSNCDHGFNGRTVGSPIQY
jgi:hypothetical protein